MKIEVGDRVTYRRNDDGITRKACITTQANNLLLNTDEYEILKIERPKWEVVEEKKELLTEEERAFLKAYLKFMELDKDDVKFKREYNKISCLFDDGSGYVFEVDIDKFCNMENKHAYTPKELGLEE